MTKKFILRLISKIKFYSIPKESHLFYYNFLRILEIIFIFFLIFYLLSYRNCISILIGN